MSNDRHSTSDVGNPLFWFGCVQPPLPLPRCGGEWKETGRKLVGRDKGSLTRQQTKGTGTTTIQIRRKHNTNHTTHGAVLPDRTGTARSSASTIVST